MRLLQQGSSWENFTADAAKSKPNLHRPRMSKLPKTPISGNRKPACESDGFRV